MRLALDRIKNAYINEPLVQDALETALMAGGGAAYQGLFTDMDAGEIGQSALLGAGLAMAARPLGARAGKAIGRHIDNVHPTALDPYKQYIPVTRDGSAAALKMMRKGGGSNSPEARGVRDLLAAKRNLAGPDAGNAEAVLSYYLRNRADNIAQGGVALLSPFLMGGESNA